MNSSIPNAQRSDALPRSSAPPSVVEDALHHAPQDELLASDHLAARARSVMRSQVLGRRSLLRRSLVRPAGLARLDDIRRFVSAARARLGSHPKLDIGPAGDWFLDNFHVIDQHLREARESLPRNYYLELPTLAVGPLAGEPRVFELAVTLIAHAEGRVELANLEPFITAAQEIAPLSLGELWALPAMLRLALIETIRDMTLRTLQRLDEREDADRWAARIEAAGEGDGHDLREVLAAVAARTRPLSPAFVSHLLHQLRVATTATPPLAKLERWLADEHLSADVASARASQQLALTQMMMANSITSLRVVSRLDWIDFVERQSETEAALAKDPAGFYARMTAATRDAYRHEVERMARRSDKTEVEVARLAVAHARAEQTARGDDDAQRARRAHVGYFLVDAGAPTLERALGYRMRTRDSVRRLVQRHPHGLFIGGIAAITAGLLVTLLLLAQATAATTALLIVAFAFLPAVDFAVNAINQLITAVVRPRRLPKLEVRASDDDPALQTAIVMPVLLGNLDAVTEALHNLEVQYLSNPESYLRFVLLGDFTDAPSESLPEDAAIVAAASAGVDALNERYATSRGGPFHLLHRARRFNVGERCWMGWERKRGKLVQLNAFLRGTSGGAFAYVVGDPAPLMETRFVITLDADTMLPAEGAALLIGALAHPLNRPVFDPIKNCVIAGYSILQPRVVVSLPSAQCSKFAALQSGRPGVDPYTTSVSDVYQDLYGEGSYSGKGIYDVDAFVRATRGRFPERALLSHDLIEGCFGRAGLVTDVNVYDDYPARYLTFARRKHRWIRGDWQLLPWLRRYVPGPAGRERTPLSILARLKIFDNLRRSVTELAQLSLLVAGWTLLPGSVAMWSGITLFLIAAPWLISLLLAALRPPLDKSWWAYYRTLGRDALTGMQQVALAVVFLLHQAWISVDAIVRTVFRLAVTRRQLLEWQTAAQVEHRASGSARETLRHMAPVTAASMAGLALACAFIMFVSDRDRTQIVSTIPWLSAWLLAPAIAHRLSIPTRHGRRRLSHGATAVLVRHARAHWHFFERFTSAETGWLTPDNFQDDPAPVLALRTSPTNIGLQLLATVSAHELGFIAIEEMLDRLERAFDTLESLPRHEGHLYNWYSLETRAVLEPAYVSTVDSGNLAGHCIALRQGCLALAATLQPELAPRLRAVAERAYRLCTEMDFRFLYDRTRKLFAIGYHVGTRKLDDSFYDLLASEARLASFVAIAKNDVPVEHWFRLGRMLTRADGETSLVSWSGSMFEYLMPLLVMQSFSGTLLDQTHRSAIRRQIAHGAARAVPWGMSESAYNLRDRHRTYQYRAFGVPDLALKRGMERDLVIAPYATVLALLLDPARALSNLAALEALGAAGPYGFCDALDYSRPTPGKTHARVSTYMAHHVGMSLVALTNVLTEDLWTRRFHADPLVRSAELMLQERVPRAVAFLAPHASEPTEARTDAGPIDAGERTFAGFEQDEPHVALLGQYPYTLMVSQVGAGYSRFEDVAVTRFRADGTTDDTGQFCYLKDLTTGHVWSATHQPVCAEPDFYRAVLSPDRARFHRRDGLIETQTEITVVPEDAAEIRRVTVTNHSTEPRLIELTSYGEIVLTSAAADRAHPAFSNLFVETEWHEWCSAISATRRPRAANERTLVCMHVVDCDPAHPRSVSCETDRARFIGRGRSRRDPAALSADGPLSGTTGAVLDPIFALRVQIALAPGESTRVAFTTLVAQSRVAAFALADRYRKPQAAQRALDLAWTATLVELRELNVSSADAAVFQELAGALLYDTPALRASSSERRASHGSQRLLWAQGISGDWPIVFARIDEHKGLTTLKELFAAHHYWRRRGMTVDLVVLNTQPTLYLQELAQEIIAGLFGSSDAGMLDRAGGVFILRQDLLTPETLRMLIATARLHVPCNGRPLAHMLAKVVPTIRSAASRVARPLRALPRLERTSDSGVEPVRFDNGFGGLTVQDDYQIRVAPGHLPPAPWANVVANADGGFCVTERGGGFTWAESSYFFRLTPWYNDPVSDPVGDVLYLRDEHSGEIWSATPAPVDSPARYTVQHRAGSSIFATEHAGIASHLTLGLAEHGAVKISRLRLTNRGTTSRTIAVTAYVEWTLGVLREHTQHQVHTTFDPAAHALFARNFFDPQFAEWVAFCASTEPVTSYSGSRGSFLGRNGHRALPAALAAARLDGQVGAGRDPCAALQSVIFLAAGETRELAILLGAASSEAGARAAIEAHHSARAASAALARSGETWTRRLSTITVRTPEPTFDAMINRWTLYQTLACRVWARSAIYQSSGAYGFRDQLQDVMALVYAEPQLARAHILRSAARQFPEGDVQHWWHDGTGQGTRTRFSDDLAWLPYAVAHYVRTTGDLGVLDEQIAFLDMRSLAADEHELYSEPRVSSETATLREHCLRALQRACTRGPHELPLIGTGDWNDSMNLVGASGRGESVWLAWFLIRTVRSFDPFLRSHDEAAAEELMRTADDYVRAVEAHGWDGEWYRRAYFDDGTPLGTASAEECRIDAIAQSWSVISGAGSPERQARALAALERHLVDEQARIILLLAPPFDKTSHDPGYIKGYLPGVRENGAQYTHAALWTVLAFALHGDGDRALALYQMLNPLNHTRTAADVARYKVEPYVVAADVYAAAGQHGRGGWTWYTGSASWMYRVGLEAILGFDKRGDTLYLAPTLPRAWPGFSLDYRYGESHYAIEVIMQADGPNETQLDGRVLADGGIPLTDDRKKHQVIARRSHAARSRGV